MQYLTTDSVGIKDVKRIAKMAKVSLWPEVDDPEMPSEEVRIPAGVNVLTKKLDNQKLTALLDLPIENIIDAGANDASIIQFMRTKKSKSRKNSIGVLLTSASMYECDVAQIFTEALRRRLNFSVDRFAGIHMAVHESLVNGLTHGNLQLSSTMRQTAKDLAEYMHILAKRLKDPAFAKKALSISASWNAQKLKISIRDEGDGYSVCTSMRRMPDVSAKSGRGLRLIAGTADSCTIDDFGREITLSFLLKETDQYKGKHVDVDGPAAVASDLSASHVLIVEDEPSNQTLLGRFLNIMGINDIDVASDGLEALHKIAARIPDLIILDITMPRMNGYEVLHHLKSNDATKDIPVLIQTASDNRETRDQTFKLGATDFLIKPLNPLEFFSRVRVHLENRMLIKKLQDQLKQVDTEMALAQRMQIKMLPGEKAIEDVRQKYKLDIAYFFEPSSKLGGDYWQMFPISKDEVGIYICDFSGHGMSAALNTFRLHAIVSSLELKIKTPSGFLRELNRHLLALLPRGQFATLFFGIWNVKKRIVTYAGAGSPPFIVKTKRQQMLYRTSGLPLGIGADPRYDDHVIEFKKGDCLFLFSDAWIESPNEAGVRLGEDGFSNFIADNFPIEVSAQKSLEKILKKYEQHSRASLFDDATAVLIRSE